MGQESTRLRDVEYFSIYWNHWEQSKHRHKSQISGWHKPKVVFKERQTGLVLNEATDVTWDFAPVTIKTALALHTDVTPNDLGKWGRYVIGGFKSGTHNQLIFVLRVLIIAPRACSHVYLHRKCPEQRSCSMTHITMVTVQHTCCLSFSLWVDITFWRRIMVGWKEDEWSNSPSSSENILLPEETLRACRVEALQGRVIIQIFSE